MSRDPIFLVERIARLNPDAGEIGPGMLRQLVEDARAILAEREERNEHAMQIPGEDTVIAHGEPTNFREPGEFGDGATVIVHGADFRRAPEHG